MTVTYTVPITLVTRTVTGQDALGNDVHGDVPTELAGVFAPGGSSEVTSGQDLITTQPTVYLPTGTATFAIDAILVGGLKYEVDGEPQNWPPNPFSGWLPDYSVVVKLRRVTG